MKHVLFNPYKVIELKAVYGATVAKAVNEAINFCRENNVKQCDLWYDNYLFDITPESDLKEKLADYNSYLKYLQDERDNACKCKSLEYVTYKTINADEKSGEILQTVSRIFG